MSCPNMHAVQLIIRDEVSKCIRCKKYSFNFYECAK
jgi:hypothetical protein